MDRRKKRLSIAFSSMRDEISSVENGIRVLETRAQRLVEMAMDEADTQLFNSSYDNAKREIEKACWLLSLLILMFVTPKFSQF